MLEKGVLKHTASQFVDIVVLDCRNSDCFCCYCYGSLTQSRQTPTGNWRQKSVHLSILSASRDIEQRKYAGLRSCNMISRHKNVPVRVFK
jgi:hypothetical protein